MSFLRLFLGFPLLFAVALAAPRVAIVVEAPSVASDYQAMLTAELTRLALDVDLVERAELARAWSEQALATRSTPALGVTPLSVDRYLHFRQVTMGRWVVDYLDAASGSSLGSLAVTAEKTVAPGQLAPAAIKLLAAPEAKKPRAHSPRVAVIEAGDGAGNAELFGLAAHLRAALIEASFTVLDRSLTQELAVEQNDAARGFRATAPIVGLLGLDYWIALSSVEARLVRARDGVVLAVRPREATPSPNEVNLLQRWARPWLDGSPSSQDLVVDYRPQVETEALVPFYRGLGLYDAGRYIEAITEFTRAYLINDRFVQAYQAEARCYEALGMPELASATRRFLEIGQVENLTSGSARTEADGAIAFVGVIPIDGEDLAPIARSLSALLASQLAARTDMTLRLPDEINRLRQEYDWMSGTETATGRRWEQAPSLFSRVALSARLERTSTGLRLVWLRYDQVTGERAEGASLDLAADPQQWAKPVARFARNLRTTPVNTPTAAPAYVHPVFDDTKKLTSDYGRATGLDLNAARLRLALAEPDNMRLQGRRFEKGRQHVIENYSDLLEYALREWRISRLPAASLTRRWLELERAREHLGAFSAGENLRGAPLDGRVELARLAAPPRSDAPGLLARYWQLYAQQGEMEPAQLHEACQGLLNELTALDPTLVPERKLIERHITALARMSKLAAGLVDPSENFVFDSNQNEPRPLLLEWQKDGNPLLKSDKYRIMLRFLDRFAPQERVTAARAALAANGNTASKIDLRWLQDMPLCLPLSDPISEMFFALDRGDDLPIAHPLQPELQRAYLRAAVDYMPALLEHWCARAQDHAILLNIDTAAGNFFHLLNGYTLREVVSDADYEAMRTRVAAAFDKAAVRLGEVSRDNWIKVHHWRELTRELGREQRKDFLRDHGRWVMNPEPLVNEFEKTDAQLVRKEPDGSLKYAMPAWWAKLREWQFDYGFSAPEMAAFYARRTTEALAYVRAQPRLSLADAQAFFEQALWLHYGQKEAEAEPLYRALLELPPGSFATPAEQAEIQANAAFRLAQLTRFAGRFPEAIAYASRALDLSNDAATRLIAQRFTYKWNDNNLRTVCTRLLRDMRFDPSRLALPQNTRVVVVSTPNGDNPQLPVFYRLPAASASGAVSAKRVLVIAPTNNQDALDYLDPRGAWARFADAHDLVLVVPQFHASDTPMRVTNRFTHARFAQVWSGAALLEALERIGRQTPLDAGRLLLHGQTSGGGFATTFAAWRPDRVAAVSVLNGNWGMPRTELPGLRPRTEWKQVRFYISSGELDNSQPGSSFPRYDTAVDFVTRLMGNGVPVEWRSWPAVYHQPTAQMEDEAREFLARQLKP